MAPYVLATPGFSTTESILKLIGLILICFVIILASFFTTRFIGRRQQGVYSGSNFRAIDTYRLGQNKYLQLIKAGEHYIVIAVCKDSVTKIAELDAEEVTIRENETSHITFKEIMEKLKTKTK